MPELPEIETIKNGLEPVCKNRYIEKSQIHTYELRYPVLPKLDVIIKKHKILSLHRRSKYLIVQLDNGHLLFHLGMAGKIYITKPSYYYQRHEHEHITIYLDDGTIISFCDRRKFGAVIWTNLPINTHPLIKKLGAEPFSKDFTAEHLYIECLKRRISIKQLLMEGKTVAGIGNIYASEILFYSKVKPNRITNTISLEECKAIYRNTRFVLKKAIQAGGTSIRDFRNHENDLGSFAQELTVYGRAGKKCFVCNQYIVKIIQNKRSSFYCPICQI